MSLLCKLLNLKYVYNIHKVSSRQLNNKDLKNSVLIGLETDVGFSCAEGGNGSHIWMWLP